MIIMEIATITVPEQCNMKINTQMRKRAIQAMLQSENQGELQGFISILFGFQTVLTKSKFLARLASTECNWIFRGYDIRKRMSRHFLNEETLM